MKKENPELSYREAFSKAAKNVSISRAMYACILFMCIHSTVGKIADKPKEQEVSTATCIPIQSCLNSNEIYFFSSVYLAHFQYLEVEC